MAQYEFELIKVGYVNKEIKTILAIKDIIFEADDEIVTIPTEHDGMKVECVGFKQGFIDEHVRYHDWHHSSQGDGERVPAEYVTEACNYIRIPENVKKIIFPSSIGAISFGAFNHAHDRVQFVLEEGITHCKVNTQGKLTYNYKWL